MVPQVIFADEQIAVAVKPYGVLSEDGAEEKGMPALLREQLGGGIYPVHRLDRTTEGVMVFARNKTAAARLSGIVASGGINKEYLAVVEGEPADGGELCDLLYFDRARNKSYVVRRERRGVKEARLWYERLATASYEGRTVSLVRIALLTGRTHQIRVQFASRRYPLVGDLRYGSTIQADQIALCACALRFAHPASGEELRFVCEPTNEIFQTFEDR